MQDQHRRSGPRSHAERDDGPTSLKAYVALVSLMLLAAIAAATWSERSFPVKPASGSAQAMALAAGTHAAAVNRR